MNDFPPSPFLESLTGDFSITVSDYQRIDTVLRAGGPWSVQQLHDALLALLAKNEDQAEVFQRRFRAFFAKEIPIDHPLPELDLRQGLADLERLLKRKAIPIERPPPPRPKPVAKRHQPELLGEIATRIGLWAGVSLVILVLFAAGVWFLLQSKPPPAEPIAHFSTDRLDFGEQPLGKPVTRPFTISNKGGTPLKISDLKIAENPGKHFGLDGDYFDKDIPPGQSIVVTVIFNGQEEGSHSASITITHTGETKLHTVTLQGKCLRADPPPAPRWRRYPELPHMEIRMSASAIPSDWQLYAAIACFILLAVLIYGLWLWRSHRVPEDREAYWEKDGPRHFRLGAVGGKPAPRLSEDDLNELADSMGYYRSELAGKALDVAASIEATGQSGGIPRLVFQRRRQIRSLLILEDAFAEATAWNPIADELAAGLQKRGLPVVYGRFGASPAQFRTPDGAVHHLEDLADQRRGYLLLIFSDGKNFYRERSRFALRDLARWPMVAWLELREPRFWDETSALPVEHGIPIYPATAAGALQAVRRFLTEQGSDSDFSDVASMARGAPGQTGMRLNAHLEQLLGDALLWAQDCAMLQPISPGLADALRREFHPDLPPERIERLYALPGTVVNVSGLRFSVDVLRVLRTGFQIRRDETAQEAVLRFLLGQVKKAEPTDDQNSLAHIAWEAVCERLRLELEPDYDVKRLAELAQTPLGHAIKAELEDVGMPEQPDKIPLRIKPSGKDALQRLARLGESFEINKLEAYPVARQHWLTLGLLAVAFVGFGGWGTYGYFDALKRAPSGISWQVLGPADIPVLLEVKEGDEWQVEGMGNAGELTKKALQQDREYRLVLYGGGHKKASEFKAESGKQVLVTPETKEELRPCREAIKEAGVIIQVCPEDEATPGDDALQIALWRERVDEKQAGGRRLSIGLEVYPGAKDAPELRRWRDLLLRTGSVDAIYQVDRPTAEALAFIRRDLGPMIEPSQLVVWVEDPAFIWENIEFFDAFAAAVKVSREPGLAWIERLEGVFSSAETATIGRAEIERVLDAEKSALGGGDVVLVTASLVETVADTWREPTTGMEFVLVPGGCFQMGSPESEEGRYSHESPQHEVCVDGFWLGKTEVTNAQYRFFRKNHDSKDYEGNSLDGDDQPAVYVSWEDAKEYAQWLSKQGDADFDLPTEAQWEYACRAGTTTARYWGESPDEACPYASVVDQTAKRQWSDWDPIHNCDDGYVVTAPAGSFQPNKFGLYDMLGNVYEWVEDVYSDTAYEQHERDNPIYMRDGSVRVLRGGSWFDYPRYVRCALRSLYAPGFRGYDVGFRLRRIR